MNSKVDRYKSTWSSVRILVAVTRQLEPCIVGGHTPEEVHAKDTIILHCLSESREKFFVNVWDPPVDVVTKMECA